MRTVAMETYETSATVEDRGQVHLAGVPFAPGTEVEVTISPKGRSSQPDGGAGAGLRWEGDVLVHDGAGIDKLTGAR
jgi:hypothetical protein